MFCIVSFTSYAKEGHWDMPLAYSPKNYHSTLASDFAEKIKAKTDGDIQITTHPSGSLFKGNEIFRAVRIGQVPIGERLISALGNEDPVFEVDTLPFLATNFEEAWDLYRASKPVLELVLREKGLKFLYAVPWPPQGLYTQKPITKLVDLKGTKFRAYNALTVRLAQLMEAIPTKIEAAELSQAFATGLAQSMITSASTGYDRKIWEHVKYWYNVQAWIPKNMVFMNLKVWQSMDKHTQRLVLESASRIEKDGWNKVEELSKWYTNELKTNGMTVSHPDEKLKKDFKNVGDVLKEEWLKRAGKKGLIILEAYEEAKKI